MEMVCGALTSTCTSGSSLTGGQECRSQSVISNAEGRYASGHVILNWSLQLGRIVST